MTIGQRIKQARGKESQEAFSQRFNLHRNTLSRWETDERPPDVVFLQELIKTIGIAPEWLLAGQGEMMAPSIAPDEPQTVATHHYADAIDERNELRKQVNSLWPKVEALTKENGELRAEIERLKGKLALLEQR